MTTMTTTTFRFLDPEGGPQKATLVVVSSSVMSSLKIPKAILIRSGAQQNSPQIYRVRFSAYFVINE